MSDQVVSQEESIMTDESRSITRIEEKIDFLVDFVTDMKTQVEVVTAQFESIVESFDSNPIMRMMLRNFNLDSLFEGDDTENDEPDSEVIIGDPLLGR